MLSINQARTCHKQNFLLYGGISLQWLNSLYIYEGPSSSDERQLVKPCKIVKHIKNVLLCLAFLELSAKFHQYLTK